VGQLVNSLIGFDEPNHFNYISIKINYIMAINTLSQSLSRKGANFVNNLLNQEVIITEKLDTYRIQFEKNKDEITFYKKDNTPISIIERTLNDLWETALVELPVLLENIKLPERIRFGLYFCPIERPLRIPYTNLPKYILTDMTRRENNKIVESYDYDEVKQWSGLLCMGRPPVLFKGYLNEVQKKVLLDYDTKQYDGKEMTFSKMIEKVLGASYSKENVIEGIIIQGKNDLTQIISYEFELLDEAYQKINSSRDFYDITLTSLNNFMNNYKMPVLEADSRDEMYLEIICDIFNKYCETNDMNESVEPKYLTPKQFGYQGKLNQKYITNEITRQWLKKAPIYEALFKVFLSSFRKYKKPYGLLNESLCKNFNTYVYLVNSYADKFNDGQTKIEQEILEQRSENIVVNTLKRRKMTDIDNMRVIASIQKAFQPETSKVVKGKKKCVVYLTSFVPFSNSQMENVRKLNQMWQCPVILASVKKEFKVEGKNFHLADETVRAEMRTLADNNIELIPAYIMLDSWNLVEIFEFCRPNYEPIAIITDVGKRSELSLQLFFEEEVMDGRINVEPEFNIGEIENEDRLISYRAIEDANSHVFREFTPQPIWNLYDSIITEYKNWSGMILLNKKE